MGNATTTLERPPQDNSSSPDGPNEIASGSVTTAPGNEVSCQIIVNPVSVPGSVGTNLDFLSGISSQTSWSLDQTVPDLLPEMQPFFSSSDDVALQMEVPLLGSEVSFPNPIDAVYVSSDSAFSSSCPSPLGSSESTNISFPDSYYLPVNALTLLKALFRIALRLQCNTTTIWMLEANSPFNDGTHTALTTQKLPPVWRPTLSQSSMPHHPVIDLLPWPNVRDRILLLLSLPDEARPPTVTGPLGVVQLVYDLEDAAEGMRVWGNDPCEPTSWEVGQVLFERWWFVFDREVIEQSNSWRRLRGAPMLTMKKE